MELLASDVPAWLLIATALVFGAIWGSFFNVAIYRWPRDMSVVRPASHCPHCGAENPAAAGPVTCVSCQKVFEPARVETVAQPVPSDTLATVWPQGSAIIEWP